MQSFKRKCTNGNPFWEYIEVFLHENTSMTPVDLVNKPRRPRITELYIHPALGVYTVESNRISIQFFDNGGRFSFSGTPSRVTRKFISITHNGCII